MKSFFSVTPVPEVIEICSRFPRLPLQPVSLSCATSRILGETLLSPCDVPGFDRSTRDGFALKGASTFGAAESAPTLLSVTGSIAMGEVPTCRVGHGEAVRIATGGMLPAGADAVIMVEHTTEIDPTLIEASRAVAPGTHVIRKGDDATEKKPLLSSGKRLRPQEIGYLAAAGITEVAVVKQPVVGILSTGDEIVPPDAAPRPGQVRDINTATLSAMVVAQGGIPRPMGIIPDDANALSTAIQEAVDQCDMVLLSGGSSVGTRDLTLQVIQDLPASELLVHGIAISPGKPTVLAAIQNKPVWGLPGHAASAAIVFHAVVRPCLGQLTGEKQTRSLQQKLPATLTRNIASAQGRTDYIRVRLHESPTGYQAEPVLGEAGLIRTLVAADGVIVIPADTEGLFADTPVFVHPL